jgi:hypothetical protein
MKDPLIRATEIALARYGLTRKPTAEITHALVGAVLELLANRSGMKASLIVGDGVITRGGE